MKRLILALVASTLIAAPAAQAQSWNGPSHGSHQVQRKHVEDKRHRADRHVVKKTERHVVKKRTVGKARWHRGDRLPGWQRNVVVRDYHRHGLRRPARGQHWVKVDNHYLLVGITSGIIAGLFAAR
jgi:Ni/Co efflux regulator RcnB